MGGTAQDITDLATSDALAARATRRLELMRQMAMAANQATTLDEAIAVAAATLPGHSTWSPLFNVRRRAVVAAHPLPNAMPCFAPSSAARHPSSAVRVGLPARE